MGDSIYPRLRCYNRLLRLDGRRVVEVNDYTLLAWFAWGVLCFIFGAVMMAAVRVERGDLDEEEENFDFWIDE